MRRILFWSILAASSLFAFGFTTFGAAGEDVNADGTVVIKDLAVPLSNLLSPEARAYMIHLLVDQPFSGGPTAEQDIKGCRARQNEIMNVFLGPIRQRFPVNIEERTIDGVFTQIVTPKDGIAADNRDRILLNVHGGGLVSGARTASLVESIPFASIEKIKVISVDYRMGPEFKFPAASEDVAAVYKEVLKSYEPEHIGLYGCSAGGMLSGMSIAWFQKHDLPNPAAIGILCASLGNMFAGEAAYLVGPLMGMSMPPAASRNSLGPPGGGPGYLSNVDPRTRWRIPSIPRNCSQSFRPRFSSPIRGDSSLLRPLILTMLSPRQE